MFRDPMFGGSEWQNMTFYLSGILTFLIFRKIDFFLTVPVPVFLKYKVYPDPAKLGGSDSNTNILLRLYSGFSVLLA